MTERDPRMTPDEWREYAATTRRLEAEAFVHAYARRCCPTVPDADVEAIVRALGEGRDQDRGARLDAACETLDQLEIAHTIANQRPGR